jgi:LysR family glycine cleavage system transcriptional activator
LKRPRLNILRTFDAAGRHLSFSLAAEELNISQAAVSQQIRQLEDYLNTDLFVRHHRSISLTSTGKAYQDAVHEALDRLDLVTDQLFPAQNQATVTLRCTAGVAALWLAPQLKSFQSSHQNIDLRVKTLDQVESRRNTEASELEIFISADKETGPTSTRLFTSTITPVCSPELFARRQPPKAPGDLLEYGLIHVLGYADDWHRWFRHYHPGNVNPARGLLLDGSLIAIEAAARGDGIMLGRRPFIDNHLKSGDLVEVFSKPYFLHAEYYLKQPAKKTASRASKIVANWLAELAEQVPDSELPGM